MIMAVDFDGTLCESDYPQIGAPKKAIIDTLIYTKSKGDKLILWTCRSNERLAEAVAWCESKGLTFDAINENLPEIKESFGGDQRKVYADYYIDDRSLFVPGVNI